MGAPIGNCNAAKNKTSCKLKKRNGRVRYFKVEYTKRVGGRNSVVVKGRNKNEALQNARYNIFTGRDFKVIRRVPKTIYTVKGPGANRAN